MATPKQTDPQFKLRFTADLRDQIEQAAKANNRSMNAEIVDRLEASFAPGSMMALIDAYEAKLNEAIAVNKYLEELKVIHEARLEEADIDRPSAHQIEAMKTEEPIFNIVLDAKGRPISWPEIAAHIHRTAKAAGIEAASFRAAIFNAEKQDDDAFYGEYARLIRWYQEQTRKHKDMIRADPKPDEKAG